MLKKWRKKSFVISKLLQMGGLVGSALACYSSSPGSNPDISQKYKMGDISEGVNY
jgi:hypothetical protein